MAPSLVRPCRTPSRLVLPALLAFAAGGCGDALPGDRPDVVEHPIPDSMTVDPAEAIVVGTEANAPGAPAELVAFAHRLENRRSVATLGLLEGEEHEVFGLLTDAEILGDGSVALLDRQNSLVHLFDAAGSFRETLGRRGDGPGEVRAPVALLSPGGEELWMVDSGRIHRFEPGESGFAYRDRLTFASFPMNACTVGGSVVLHVPAHMPGEGVPRVLFRLEEGGELDEGFAEPYRYDRQFAAQRVRRGVPLCAPGGGVLLAYEVMNRLDAWDPESGELLWHATFDGIRIPPLEERTLPDGRDAVSSDFDRWEVTHVPLGAAGGDGVPAIFQFGRRDRTDGAEGDVGREIESFLVDPESGNGIALGEGLPHVLAVNGERIVLLLDDEPYPQVEIATLGAP